MDLWCHGFDLLSSSRACKSLRLHACICFAAADAAAVRRIAAGHLCSLPSCSIVPAAALPPCCRYSCPHCKSRQQIQLTGQQEANLRVQAKQILSAAAQQQQRQGAAAAAQQQQRQAAAAQLAAYSQALAAAAAAAGSAPRPQAQAVRRGGGLVVCVEELTCLV